MIGGLGTRLRALIAELDGDVQSIYDDLGVEFRPRFYPIVRALLEKDMLSIGAIAQVAQVSQPAATQTINEMKKLELVASATASDARRRLVGLTPKGRDLCSKLAPVWEAAHRAAEELDCELAMPLGAVLDEALRALRNRSFRDRVRVLIGEEI
jgi:MarR family transcriptional regulator, organic hydroperoxide resistance regulator